MKKLLITGDSYCASRNPKSWTNILADRLNAELTLAGAVSASLYYAYDNLINLDDNHAYLSHKSWSSKHIGTTICF
jgi:hypothetical protein